MQKTGLGRGLDALISLDDANEAIATHGAPSSILEVDIELIHPNPNQPRRTFDEASIDELAQSISNIGIIQPLTLRQEADGTYLIVAGERRYRAAQRLGLAAVPAYVRRASDDEVMEMALIENIQREDLNVIEVALAYRQLQSRGNLTQEELAQRVGQSRPAVANVMRLLRLPAEVQLALKERQLQMGHARALLGIDNAEQQVALFRLIKEHDLTVRRVEALVKDYVEGRILDFTTEMGSGHGQHKPKAAVDPATEGLYRQMEQHLSQMFSTRVRMKVGEKGEGRITIPFKSDSELQNILQLLDRLGQ